MDARTDEGTNATDEGTNATDGQRGTTYAATAAPPPALSAAGLHEVDEPSRYPEHYTLHPGVPVPRAAPDAATTIPTAETMRDEARTLVVAAAVNAMRSPEFIPSLERAMRLDPLKFVDTLSKFLGSDKGAPTMTLNNIITSIPRGPLDELPEGFRRN